MLAAVAYALAFIEFPVPFAPNIAKVDLSYFPALTASFAFDPLAGIAVEFVKNALQLLSTSTFGIGELANFLIGSSLAWSAGMIYKRRKTRKGAWLACRVGSIFMGMFAAFLNYFVLFPLYGLFMPVDAMIASFSEVMLFIQTKFDFCVLNALPFTALKGLFTSFVTLLAYKRLSPLLKWDTITEEPIMDFTDISKMRITVRKFGPYPVEAEIIEKVLDASRWSTTAMNYQRKDERQALPADAHGMVE